MEAADCLLGVTMQPGGSSRVVTERVPDPHSRRGTGRARGRTGGGEHAQEGVRDQRGR